MVTILDESDAVRLGKWSEKTLSQRYLESYEHLKAAEPQRDYAKRADPVEKLMNKEGS